MADSKLTDLNGGVGIVAVADADEMYIEDAGVAKFVTGSVLKTYMSLNPTLVGPTLGGHVIGGGYDLTKLGTISMTEQAAANADVAGDGQLWIKTATPNELFFTDDAGTDFKIMVLDASGVVQAAIDLGGFDLNNGGVFFMTEQAAAEADVAGKGQIWIKDDTPNTIWFTDDAGTDFQIGTLAGTESLSNKTLAAPIFSGEIAGEVVRASGVPDFSRRNRVLVCDEDFVLAAGGTIPPPFAKTIVGAGPPTGDYANDALNGEYVLTTEGTSELQSVTVSYGDQLVIDPTKNPVFEARLKIAPAGAQFTADERVVIGLAAARNATLDSNTAHAWFRMEGANLDILVEADDGATDTDDQDSTINYAKDTYVTLRIDLSDLSDIKFYVDGVEQGGAAVAAAALDATMKLQPYLEIQRDAGGEVNVVTLDYMFCEQDRA